MGSFSEQQLVIERSCSSTVGSLFFFLQEFEIVGFKYSSLHNYDHELPLRLGTCTYHEYGFIACSTFVVELNLVTSHVSKVFFCLLRSACAQPLIVLYFPGFGIVCAVLPFLIFWNAIEGLFFFALANLSLKCKHK